MERLNAFRILYSSIDSPDQAKDLPSVLTNERLEFRGFTRLTVQKVSDQLMFEVILHVWSEDDATLLSSSDQGYLFQISLDRR